MDHAANTLLAAHSLYARNETSAEEDSTNERPPVYKAIGIALAISSGAFIGTSFVLKKYGLLKANEKYNEEAGEGYGYLKNVWWWAGMTLMIVGEICNFVAYAFTDAILVTPLGALSVVITTVLSAIFLKERLSMVGKVACFLCIVGAVVIVMNAPSESSVANIQEMKDFVIAPGFLSYTGVIIIGAVIAAFYAGPRWGKKNMLVYISICSWVGGLSVVATQGLGAAIVAQAGGAKENQFKEWFLYVLLVFVIATLLTEIIYLNKALNLFNAAMVTPTYYVYFTSTTIITSAVLFQGFKGTATSIVTVVNGFLTICSGVVLLQLSKSAKDVPDTAVFAGDLDQIQTIAEQEQPETEPKADAIRGAAAIVRRISQARMKMEEEEMRRLRDEKLAERLEPVNEDGNQPGQLQYEWDGLRRRRTMTVSSRRSNAISPMPSTTFAEPPPSSHPPLGMSHFPTEDELAAHDRPDSAGLLSSIAGTIRTRARSMTNRSSVLPGHPEYPQDPKVQSPMHPVQLTEISVPTQKASQESSGTYGSDLPPGLQHQKTEYQGGGPMGSGLDPPRAQSSNSNLAPPTPPPHSARRQFSFQNVFRRHQADSPDSQAQQPQKPTPRVGLGSRGYSTPRIKDATEEERLGLVKGDSQSLPALPRYDEDDDSDDPDPYTDDKQLEARYGRGITGGSSSPPRRGSDDSQNSEQAAYEASRRRWGDRSQGSSPPPPPPPHKDRRPPPGGGGSSGGDGAFI
ncbi:magnesium transporter NIPA-domain-containing protein [Zalerion maritima]|uniref:Magnesium transporter NIPA-domain-containing protein n=1 Tax=Zalerion maritima TaxID=339359 RepID=A0AAD5RXD8_9PEZI|nr:magnesium transporter NIPA-domain-containing protein [Zalerion maritima]